MRLSTVLELLVIALLIAFAASRVIDGPSVSKALSQGSKFAASSHPPRKDRQSPSPSPTPSLTSAQEAPGRYCSCSSLTCNCCRDFSLPVVPVKGPGCATISYLHDDAMMITMSFGDRVLRNITVNSKKPKPICMGMPGGISKFCGKLYSIKKDGENFKACLGLELRALDDVEAALRVSCFRFGPHGVNVEPGEAVPVEKNKEDEDEDDDDYGLGDLDDDDDDDDDFLSGVDDDDDDDDDDEEEEKPPAKDSQNYVDSDDSDADSDYTGLSTLSEELFGGFFGSSGNKRRPVHDEDDEEVHTPDPPRTPSTPAPPLQHQVNLVVMQPVIVPPAKPALQKRPAKPSKIAPVRRVKPTTAVPAVPPKPTAAPVRTYATTTSPTAPVATNATTTKPPNKKKKKPQRKRKPTTSRPSSNSSTEVPPVVITSTTMTVNVVQEGVLLNETLPQKVKVPAKEPPLKIPMSQPIIETKPVESIKPSVEPLKPDEEDKVPLKEQFNTGTENGNTEPTDATTQTILHNTIPVDENIDDGLQPVILQRVPLKKPTEHKKDEVLLEDQMSTTPIVGNAEEESTFQGTTIHEDTGYTNNYYTKKPEKDTTAKDSETTDRFFESKDEVTTEFTTDKDGLSDGGIQSTVVDKIASTQTLDMATVPYDAMEEATDKTEAIVQQTDTKKTEENSSDEDDDEDDDDVGIDIGADLGLDDDDDDEEEKTPPIGSNKPAVTDKPEEKDDDDDDDILGGLLDDEEDEDASKSKEKAKERTLSDGKYEINPLLYRLARVSSGSVATARHLPRFSSDGRNRRNNKRMRFSSLDITS